MKRRVIVLEDDESLRLVITKALVRAGFEVRATASADTAIERMARNEADALVADVLLGRDNFLDRLSEITQLRPDAPVIIMSAQTTVATALNAHQAGVFEYLPKPFDINLLAEHLKQALEGARTPNAKPVQLKQKTLIGQSSAMQATFKAIGRLAQISVPVLLTGPDGSGRATVARLIHEQSNSCGKLVEAGPRQLAAIPEQIWDDADDGTLLLRRAEAWPLDVQNFVRERLEADDQSRPRLLVTASDTVSDHLPPALINLVSVGQIAVPPLFRRGNDRALLFDAFLASDMRGFRLSPGGARFVNGQAWPGEVLQLKRTAQHIIAQAAPGEVDAELIKTAMRVPGTRSSDDELEEAAVRYFAGSDQDDAAGLASRAQARLERGLIRAALESAGGVRVDAARRLGMNRNTFARKLDQFDLEDED